MNDIESSEIIAWVAAIEALPMRATRLVKSAKAAHVEQPLAADRGAGAQEAADRGRVGRDRRVP